MPHKSQKNVEDLPGADEDCIKTAIMSNNHFIYEANASFPKC